MTTISELIELLKALPQDMEVITYGTDYETNYDDDIMAWRIDIPCDYNAMRIEGKTLCIGLPLWEHSNLSEWLRSEPSE